MTTTANRIAFLKQTLASIHAQTIQADAIELNIPNSYARADLEPVDTNDIPKGFNIYRCDDYGPATKLLPTLQRYRDNNVVIIYCDDTFFSVHLFNSEISFGVILSALPNQNGKSTLFWFLRILHPIGGI